jgi:acetylornithine/N-succinyldiaminopimelate aminotransferase
MAKGLAGGVPIGAMLAAPRADIFEPGEHGTTFGGNPLACAAGVATVRTILEEHLLEHVSEMGAYLDGKIKQLQAKHAGLITGTRGLGLIRAFDLNGDRANDLIDRAEQRGLLITSAGPATIRTVPPLVITREEIDEAIARLDAALGAM